MTTFNDIRKKYRALRKLARIDGPIPDEYWKTETILKDAIRAALRETGFIEGLTKQQQLSLIEWCSVYRPFEPHVVLSIFGRCAPLCDKSP